MLLRYSLRCFRSSVDSTDARVHDDFKTFGNYVQTKHDNELAIALVQTIELGRMPPVTPTREHVST